MYNTVLKCSYFIEIWSQNNNPHYRTWVYCGCSTQYNYSYFTNCFQICERQNHCRDHCVFLWTATLIENKQLICIFLLTSSHLSAPPRWRSAAPLFCYSQDSNEFLAFNIPHTLMHWYHAKTWPQKWKASKLPVLPVAV